MSKPTGNNAQESGIGSLRQHCSALNPFNPQMARLHSFHCWSGCRRCIWPRAMSAGTRVESDTQGGVVVVVVWVGLMGGGTTSHRVGHANAVGVTAVQALLGQRSHQLLQAGGTL